MDWGTFSEQAVLAIPTDFRPLSCGRNSDSPPGGSGCEIVPKLYIGFSNCIRKPGPFRGDIYKISPVLYGNNIKDTELRPSHEVSCFQDIKPTRASCDRVDSVTTSTILNIIQAIL